MSRGFLVLFMIYGFISFGLMMYCLSEAIFGERKLVWWLKSWLYVFFWGLALLTTSGWEKLFNFFKKENVR